MNYIEAFIIGRLGFIGGFWIGVLFSKEVFR